jgi:hypothetical protein
LVAELVAVEDQFREALEIGVSYGNLDGLDRDDKGAIAVVEVEGVKTCEATHGQQPARGTGGELKLFLRTVVEVSPNAQRRHQSHEARGRGQERIERFEHLVRQGRAGQLEREFFHEATTTPESNVVSRQLPLPLDERGGPLRRTPPFLKLCPPGVCRRQPLQLEVNAEEVAQRVATLFQPVGIDRPGQIVSWPFSNPLEKSLFCGHRLAFTVERERLRYWLDAARMLSSSTHRVGLWIGGRGPRRRRAIFHKGVDLSSRPAGERTPRPLDFRAGAYGVVVKAGDGPWGTIAVQWQDKTVIQSLHTSASHVKKERRLSFWADGKDQEAAIFQQFLDEATGHRDFKLFCYGSYERSFIKRMRKTATRPEQVDRVLESLVNALSLVHAHLYFPTYSKGLKDVAACLGCTWSDPNASGLQSLVWRARWEETRVGEWKQKLLAYNLEPMVRSCSRGLLGMPGRPFHTSEVVAPRDRGDVSVHPSTVIAGRTSDR